MGYLILIVAVLDIVIVGFLIAELISLVGEAVWGRLLKTFLVPVSCIAYLMFMYYLEEDAS